MYPCITCGDSGRFIALDRDNLRQLAKQRANEKEESMAICSEPTIGFYIIPISQAISEQHNIAEVISGLPG